MKTRNYIQIFVFIFIAILFMCIARDGIASERTFSVPTNHATIVDLKPGTKKVIIVNPAIADIFTITRNRVAIVGKSAGHTGLLTFDSAGRKIMSANIIVRDDADTYTIKINRGVQESTLACDAGCVEVTTRRSASTPSGGK